MSKEELTTLKRDIVKKKTLEDFHYFNQVAMQHTDLIPEVYGELVDLLLHSTKDLLTILPRGTMKTALITESYVVWSLLKNPSLRILLVLETWSKGKVYLDGIKRHFKNPVFMEIFGDMEGDLWREDCIRLKTNTSTEKEPNIFVGSLERSVTGFHPDLIVGDDLHSEANTRTQAQIEMAKGVFAELTNLSLPHTRKIILGTIWVDNDIYTTIAKSSGITDWKKILDKKMIELDNWIIYIRKAIEQTEDGETIEIKGYGTFTKSKIVFPKLNEVELTKKFSDPLMTQYTFNCQYMSDPTSSRALEFTEDMLNQAKLLNNDIKNNRIVYKYLLIDPAYTVKKRSDSTAFIVLFVDYKGFIHIELAYKEKLEPKDVVDRIFNLQALYRPNVVAIEANASQQILSSWIRETAKTSGKHFRITDVKTGPSKAKNDRIRRLLHYFKKNLIAIPEECDELFDELIQFPNGKHDDLIDALSFYEDVKRTISSEGYFYDTKPKYFENYGFTPSWMKGR